MAEEIKLNLIKEFTKIQRENELIFLTTFNFDAPFFDIYLLDKLQQQNPLADIFVLTDGDEYNRSYNSFTRHTGRRYHLIPVFCRRGVFHPKLFLFFSRETSTISSYIGSPNLTLSGFTSNAEIVTKVTSKLSPINSVIADSINFFYSLIERKYIKNRKFTDSMEYIKERIGEETEDKRIKLLSNMDTPILTGAMNEMKNPPKKVFMLAPFWSPNTKVLDVINKNGMVNEIDIALQKHNHNLGNPEIYEQYCRNNQIKLNFYRAEFEKKRRFHSKIIRFEGENDYLLVGSSNITESALLDTCSSGNFEVSVLITIDSDELIKPIKIRPMQEINDITTTVAQFKEDDKTKSINVHYVEFDLVSSVLSIGFEKSDEETKIRIIFDDSSVKEFSISGKGEINEYCGNVPFEVIFERDGVITARRVFYDSNYFYRRLSRGRISLKEISKKILSDVNIESDDLLRLLYGLSLSRPEQESMSRSSQDKREEETKRFFLPSREIDFFHNKKLINRFMELSKLLISVKAEQQEIQEGRGADIDADNVIKVSKHMQRLIDKSEERRKACSKLLKVIDDILLYQILKEGGTDESMVSAMSFFSQLFIKIIAPVHFEYTIFEDFMGILTKNLKNVGKDSVIFDIRKYLFVNLILINYTLDLRQHYSFLGDLFFEEEVVNFDFFEECKNYVVNRIRPLNTTEEVDYEQIAFHVGYLASYIPSGKTVEDDIINLIHKGHEFEDDIQFLFFKSYIENIFRRWSISRQTLDEVERLTEKISKKQRDLILKLLENKKL